MLVEEKAHGMHQNGSQQTVAQMPQITRPDPFHLATIGQLTKDCVDEVANAPQNRTLVGCRLRRMRFAERCLQNNAFRPQEGLQIGKPIVAIPQDHPRGAFQQDRGDFSIGFIGRCQEDAREQTWPTQLRMHTKAVKCLPICMIFAIARYATEADTPGRSGKTADRKWHTIHDGHARIIADYFVAQPAPQVLFDRPQVGGLPHKGCPMQTVKGGEKVRVVTPKVIKEFLILAQLQITSDHFHRNNFTIRQLWGWASCSQSLVFGDHWYHLVNQTKTCDNKIVQVHENPPQRVV